MFDDPRRLKRAVGWVAIFAMPLVIVQLAGWITGAGAAPAQAGAAEAPAAPEAVLRVIDRATQAASSDSERAAATRVEHLRHQPMSGSPMLHGAGRTAPEPLTRPIDLAQATDAALAPAFHLQAVMSSTSSRAARALINNRLYSVGDRIETSNWTIVDINAEARRVTIEDSAARRATLALDSP